MAGRSAALYQHLGGYGMKKKKGRSEKKGTPNEYPMTLRQRRQARPNDEITPIGFSRDETRDRL